MARARVALQRRKANHSQVASKLLALPLSAPLLHCAPSIMGTSGGRALSEGWSHRRGGGCRGLYSRYQEPAFLGSMSCAPNRWSGPSWSVDPGRSLAVPVSNWSALVDASGAGLPAGGRQRLSGWVGPLAEIRQLLISQIEHRSEGIEQYRPCSTPLATRKCSTGTLCSAICCNTTC